MAHSLSGAEEDSSERGGASVTAGGARSFAWRTEKLDALIAKGDVAAATTEVKTAIKLLDRTATRGTVHRNTAARRKSKLQRKINALAAAKK